MEMNVIVFALVPSAFIRYSSAWKLFVEASTQIITNNNVLFNLNRRYLVTVLSICYAISLVVFGAIVFIGDAVKTRYPLPQVFFSKKKNHLIY